MEFTSLELFPLLSRLLAVKFKQISQLISFFYLAIVVKCKPKSLLIKSISLEQFEELIEQNKYNYDFVGDFHSCALISVNTLCALSVMNKSWIRISEFGSEKKDEKEDERFIWKICMPPVETNQVHKKTKDCLIQCLCISDVLRDFVLYVTDVKLFNISNQWSKDNKNFNLVDRVGVESCKSDHFPSIAKSAVVTGIISGNDINAMDYEEILDEYFSKPKCLKSDDIIHVDLLKCKENLKFRPNLCTLRDVYLKVVSITGQSDMQEHYILKGYTSLYLNPPIHGFVPPKKVQYVKKFSNSPGFEIPICPDGLLKYFKKLEKIFKFLIKGSNCDVKGTLLLSGLKGSGKKTVLRSVAASFGLHVIHANCFDYYGLNPSLVQGKFDQLFARTRRTVPCVVLLENIELLGREQNYHENTRLVDIFESHLKELWIRKPNSYPVIIIGSTHLKPSDLIPSIARLFVYTVSFETQKLEEAFLTLKWLIKNSNMICSSEDLKEVAERVRGYVFADLVLLVQHAVRFQSNDSSLSDNDSQLLQLTHFNQGIEIMEAAYSDSIGAARVPTVHWDDVGGLADLKEEIMLTLNLPIKHPELFASGLKRSGILFYGPPGTGKTLMAKAVATECNYNFLSVKGPELMNMYVGQSEKNVREVFERAREASPCIIFFDELDSLAPSRGKSGDSGGVTDRVVSQLLAEMDGLDKNKNVFVIAATNRPDLVDPALLRPGRFDKMFYVGVCSENDSKLSVLKALTRRFSLDSNVDFEKIINELPNQVTGADLYSVCSNAWFSAARKAIDATNKGLEISLPLTVFAEDFEEAVEQFVPSLTPEDVDYYENLKSSDGNSK